MKSVYGSKGIAGKDRKVVQGALEAQQSTVIYRIIHQYNKEPVSGEDMRKLQEIAEDYRRVKNYVYARYSGIGSLSKLYPGYTVQNEMTKSGFREELSLPSVYFYRAVFDALGDIKSHWTHTRKKILQLIGGNENLTAGDKHYLRFLLKSNNAFEAVLHQRSVCLPREMQLKYEQLASEADTERLHRYLCRQVRKYRVKNACAKRADGFYITERAYRYGKNEAGKTGIFIATKENRKRIFIPLTDENAYQKQLHIRLKPEENGIEIAVPLEVKIRKHPDYVNEIGLSPGIWQMFTTHEGKVYGEEFGKLHQELTEYMSAAAAAHRREKENNVGRKKYLAHKARLDAGIKAYVNRELNRLLREEKPKTIYLPKLPKNSRAGYNKKINYSVGIWKRGLVRERLEQKCAEHSVEIVEVFGKAVSTECSRCGAAGRYSGQIFFCESCGYQVDKKINAAQNALQRGRQQKYSVQKSVSASETVDREGH